MTEFGEGKNSDMPTFLMSPVVQVIISHVSLCPQDIRHAPEKLQWVLLFSFFFPLPFPMCLGFFEGLLWAFAIDNFWVALRTR